MENLWIIGRGDVESGSTITSLTKEESDASSIETATAVAKAADLSTLSITEGVPASPEKKTTPSKQMPRSGRKGALDVLGELREKMKSAKPNLNLVVVGHVDAGKSTLMGHLLYALGQVSERTMKKYQRDSDRLGKGSFAYAWVLDETEEERNRGITIDVALTQFETPHRMITLLDAPGHRDFVPNMISGASQADVAILVVDATKGEFETGFEYGGQTKEHSLLARGLGVSQMIIAVNKMDTVEFSQERYNFIRSQLDEFLRSIGLQHSQIFYIPCSGLLGENLVQSSSEHLKTWYRGPTLLEQIGKISSLAVLDDGATTARSLL
jgi:elongation factor 1 alpha-like protein